MPTQQYAATTLRSTTKTSLYAQGLYASSPHHQSTLGFLAHVFEEDLSQLPPPKAIPSSHKRVDDAPHEPPEAFDQQGGGEKGGGEKVGGEKGGGEKGGGQPPVAEEPLGTQQGIGPQMPPGWQPPHAASAGEQGGDDEEAGVGAAGSKDDEAPVPSRRMVGPSMPTPADLTSSAAAHTSTDDAAQHDDDEDDDDLVGPPPPDFLLDVPAGSSVTTEQVAEVARVLQLLAEARAVHPPPPPGEQPFVDPYGVLGVTRDVARADIKYAARVFCWCFL